MSLTLFYDTETTGFPLWKEPSEDPRQPHLVELGAVVVDADFEIVHSLSLIVRPDGWEIPAEVSAIHGITQERALAVGVPEECAVRTFLDLHRCCALRVAFNKTFDDRIMRIALKRVYGDGEADCFKAEPAECAMWASQKIVGGKAPSLDLAFERIVGRPRAGGQHSAYTDAVDTALLYRRLSERAPCSSAT